MNCPDENVLMHMVEQALDPVQQHELEVHIDTCETCRRIMAAAVGGRATAIGTPPAPADDEPLHTGKIGDRYVIESLLGRGGMGSVYLARDQSLGREVALKLHRAGSGNDRLHREAIAMAKLAHPNVVTVFEVGTIDDRLFVAMEYVRGETLRGWLTATPRTWREVVELLLDAGQGLAAAHAAGLVHRDFKPENVLVGQDRRPRVSDFGLARVEALPAEPITPLAGTSSLDTPMTMTGTLMGTPAYMAPEQLEGGVADARSDQFAFCVVAWECLFGKRPFSGATLAALALAVERQELQRPARTEVPHRVREVIERGLRVDPAARHADMPALLGALRAAASPRGRRRIAVGAAAVAVVAGSAIAIAASGSDSDEARCAIGDDALAGAWDPPSRARVQIAFAASGLADGARILERVDGAIDGYRHAWLAMRRDACEATQLRGEQSETLLDLRMECLDRKRDELRALTQALTDADRSAVMGSIRAALGLSPVAECADTKALGAPVRPPEQAVRDRVEAERRELAGVKALRLLGRLEPALKQAEAIAARAKELKYRPLDAEVLLVLGDLKDRTGDSAAGIKLLEQCIVAADAGNHRSIAAQAWSALAWIRGYEERQFERAEFAVRMAGAAIESLGGSDELSVQLMNYEALILETKGQLPAAKAKYLAALAAREHMGQGESWQLSLLLNDLGSVERKLDEFAAARAHHERALAIRKRLFGDRHPYVFSSLNNLGNVAWSQRDYPQAEQQFRAAIAVADAVFPAEHPQKGLAYGNLASVLERQGKYQESLQAYRRALAIYEAVRGPTHTDVADTLHNLGNVLAGVDQPDEAVRAYDRALPILEKEGDDPALSGLLYDYGDLLRRRDRARAEPLLQRSIAIQTKAQPDSPDLAYPLTALGELYADTGRTRDARPLLERAVALRNSDAVPPEDRARSELALAKLLWPARASRPRALELARTAKRHLEQAGPAQRKALPEITQWLVQHE